MFILTIIFLVGLIYVVQQSLAGYSILDFSEPFESNEFYIIKNVKEMFETTLTSTPECVVGKDNAQENMNELMNLIGRKIVFGGFTLDIDYDLYCTYWNNVAGPEPLNLTIRAIGRQSESVVNYKLYHEVPPKIYYAVYYNADSPGTPCSLVLGDRLNITAKIIEPNGDPLTQNTTSIYLNGASYLDESLFDDGVNDDGEANNGIYGRLWPSPADSSDIRVEIKACDDNGQCTVQEAYCID